MTTQPAIPIDVVHLLPVLDNKLMELLKSLSSDEWQQTTIARLWKVRDVAAHLLDGNIRVLSIFRDNYFGEQPVAHSSRELIDFLNRLNADWVKAMNRVSPQLLISLLEVTGPPYCDYFSSLNPFDKSVLPVATTVVTIDPETAWKLFSKSLRPQQVKRQVDIQGDQELGETALEMVSVMA